MISSNSPGSSIILPVLDRHVEIGYSVYNYAEDTVTRLHDLKTIPVPELSFPSDNNNNSLQVEIAYSTSDNLNEFKWEKLQLNSHLRCSILTGLLPGPFWFSKFLDLHSEAGTNVAGKIFARIAVYVFAQESQKCKLSETNLKTIRNAIGSRKDCKNTSHVISGLGYGFNAILTFEIEVSSLNEKEEVEACLFLEAKHVFSELTSATTNNFHQSDQQIHWLKKAKFRFYSDGNFRLSGNYEETLSRMKNATKEHFVPVEMILSPITDFTPIRDLDSDTFTALLRFSEEKSMINKQYHLLMTDSLAIEIPNLQHRVVHFKHLIVDEHFKDTSQTILSAVKSFRKDNQSSSELLMVIEERRLIMKNLLQWFYARQKELLFLKTLLKDINIPWIADMDKFNLDECEEHVQVFLFKTKENVETISDGRSDKELKSKVFAILSAAENARHKFKENLLKFSVQIKKTNCSAYFSTSLTCHINGTILINNNQEEKSQDDVSVTNHIDLNAENIQTINKINSNPIQSNNEQKKSDLLSEVNSVSFTNDTQNLVAKNEIECDQPKEIIIKNENPLVKPSEEKINAQNSIVDAGQNDFHQHSNQTIVANDVTPNTSTDYNELVFQGKKIKNDESRKVSSADFTAEHQITSKVLDVAINNLKADEIVETNSASIYADISPNYDQTTPSIAKQFAERCRILEEGEPTIYILDAHERASRDKNLRWFEILTNPTSSANRNDQNNIDHKVLMLMGATGAGKSTLINGMINYILGVEWNDPFRFKIVKDLKSDDSTREEVNQAHSQTSCVTAYTIRHVEGMRIPYDITIIDTPGYGDTRGIDRDKEITKQIEQFLVHQQTDKEFNYVNAVCFVANAAESRLTPAQQHIFQSVTSIFGEDVRHNLRLLITFSDGNKPPVLEAINQANIPGLCDQQGGPVEHHKFNSSAIYAQNSDADGSAEKTFQVCFWNLGMQNFKLFFEILAKMPDRCWKQTRQVILSRDNIEILLKHVLQLLNTFAEKDNRIMWLKQQVTDLQNKCIDAYECFKQKRDAIKKLVPIKDYSYVSYNCQICKFSCKKVLYNQHSQLFNYDNNCTKCECHSSKHNREIYEWIIMSDEDYETKCKTWVSYKKSKELAQDEVAKTKSEIVNLSKQMMKLFQSIETNSKYLESSTLSNRSFGLEHYINTIKTDLENKKERDCSSKVNTLEILFKRYNDAKIWRKNETKPQQLAITMV